MLCWVILLCLISQASLKISSHHRDYSKCDYYENITPGKSFYFYSPRYEKGSNYLPGTNCRWRASSPNGTIMGLACHDFNVPSSLHCSIENVLFSPTGRNDLLDATAFCGKGEFVRYTEGNKISVALEVAQRARGGRFLCELSVQERCSCGRRQVTRIVGGEETLINEFTMMASLYNMKTENSICGATIISDKFVLTAAHCVLSGFKRSRHVIRVGEHNLEDKTESLYTNSYQISNIEPHPDFSESSQQNDIALVEVNGVILFNTGVGPVCLPFKYHSQTFEGEKVTAVGWGSTEFAGPTSQTLKKVELDIVSKELCKKSYDEITNKEICSFSLGKDTCQYDSGGPLLYTDKTLSPPHLYLVGIVNFGIGCASDAPSVSVRVTEYLDWIKEKTAGTTYCNV